MEDKIKLINHSSIHILNEKLSILTDPWYSGSAFNNGWSLLYENKHEDILNTLNNTNYIFISHEHPDHFSIKFFKEYKDIIIRNNIKILFQETDDMRVEKFLKSLGLNLILLKHKKEYRFDQNNSITLIKQGHIDSAFLFETNNNYHLNINDCNFIDSELNEIKSLIEDKSKKLILYIQFSYASFRPTEEWLKKAAIYKLNNIKKLSNTFNCSLVVPYASFFYFSHDENQDLKKWSNNCHTLKKYLESNNLRFCLFNPHLDFYLTDELIENNNLRNNLSIKSQQFWDNKIMDSKILFKEKAEESIKNENITLFLDRLKKYNNIYLLFLIRLLSFKKLFGDLYVKINNSDKVYVVNFFLVKTTDKKTYDLSMSSEAFNLFLLQPFGLESLLVSGRLKCKNNFGMRKLTSAIGITTINLSGYGVNFKDLFNKLIFNKIIGLIYRAIVQKT